MTHLKILVLTTHNTSFCKRGNNAVAFYAVNREKLDYLWAVQHLNSVTGSQNKDLSLSAVSAAARINNF